MKQRILLIVAVVMGLLAAFLTKQYHSAQEQALAKERAKLLADFKQAPALVYARDLPADSMISSLDDLGEKNIQEAALRSGYVRLADASRVVNRRVLRSVKVGDPVYWSDLEGGEQFLRPSLARDVPRTMRAISINVTGSASVSGQVRPNDHVDVIGTFVLDSQRNPGEKEQVTLTVLQNVIVLATGRETSKTIANQANERASSYSTVTLLVTPREAETLVACEQNRGKLTLALRNPDDQAYEDELPTVDFKIIRETLGDLNENRQKRIVPGFKTPPRR